MHLYGYAVDFSKLIKICKRRNIKIIEDCAQSLGAEVNGKKVGSIDDFSDFDYVGAVWSKELPCANLRSNSGDRLPKKWVSVGNGGLSLRREV